MAQYRPETFEVLAYNLTVKQLVEKLGYPRVRPQLSMVMSGRCQQHSADQTSRNAVQELKDYRFDWRYMVRWTPCSLFSSCTAGATKWAYPT